MLGLAIGFWLMGIATMFVWNCLLSMSDYLAVRFDATAGSYYPFFYNVGGFVGFGFYDLATRMMTFKKIVIGFPVILVAIFVVVFLLGELMVGASRAKFWVMLGLVLLAGVVSSIMQTSFVSHTFKFTYREITVYQFGIGACGIFTSLIALLSVYFLAPDQYFLKTLVYLIFQILVLVLIVVCFILYFRHCPEKELPEIAEPREDEQAREAHGREVIEHLPHGTEKQLDVSVDGMNCKPNKDVRLLATAAIIWPFMLNMVHHFSVSLAVFPTFVFALGLGWDNKAYIQVIIMAYSGFDCFSRLAYNFLQMKDSPLANWLASSRAALIVFICFALGGKGMPILIDKWYITLPYVALLGGSHGYLSTALFSVSAERSPPEHKAKAGFLMSVCLLTGLSYGSLAMMLGSASLIDM